MNSNYRLVYSTDPKDKIDKDKKEVLNAEFDIKKLNLVFAIEKSGRGGKIVTLLKNLPRNQVQVENLCKELKSKCGVGGTYKDDGAQMIIEIQGDKRNQIKKILDSKGIKYRGDLP